MGNSLGHSHCGCVVQPSNELKWKVGNRTEPVPCPNTVNAANFDTLLSQVDFKDYLCRNLDSEYLVSSILDNADDEVILLEGIIFFQNLNTDLRNEVVEQIENFRRVIAAGINVKLMDTLSLCEKELESKTDARSSPYLRSFQRRLAALRGLEKSIEVERSTAQGPRSGREYAETPLCTQTYPHLFALDPLNNAGLALLRMLPICISRLSSADELIMFLSPVLDVCQSIDSVSNLAMFSTWSPPPKHPETVLKLDVKSATASSGDAYKALDGSSTTYWSSFGSSGTWTLFLNKPADVSSIRIVWSNASSPTAPPPASPSGPPKTLTVHFQRLEADGISSSAFEAVEVFDSKSVRRGGDKQSTVVYLVQGKGVTAIQLTMSNVGVIGQSSQIRMFSFEALTPDTEARWVDTLSTLTSLQSALFPLFAVQQLQHTVCRSIFSLVRISGSLSLLLSLVRFIEENNFDKDKSFRAVAAEPMLVLLKAMHSEDSRIRQEIKDLLVNQERALTDVFFDQDHRSPECEIREGGLQLCCTVLDSNAYGLLSCVMDSGIWEWEFSIAQDEHGDETTCLGVGLRPVTDSCYTTSASLWLVRCYNGELYHGGTTDRRTVSQIHPNDICKFTYNADALTLSLCVNDVDQGVIFDRIPRNVSPAVSFYGADRAVRLLSMRRKGGAQATLPEALHPLHDPPTQSQIEHTTSLSTLLLSGLADLAASRSLTLEGHISPRASAASALEYPFCIEVSRTVLSQLVGLLNSQRHEPLQTLAVLHILEAQFICLAVSEVDPAHAGFDSQPSGAPDTLLSISASTLNTLLLTGDPAVRNCAGRVLARSIPVLMPNILERVELMLNLVTEMAALEETSAMLDSKTVLLKMLIQQMSRCKNVLMVIESYKVNRAWRNRILDLMSRLIDAVSGQTILDLNSDQIGKDIHKNKGDDFRKFALEFLWKFQEQLFYDVITTPTENTHSYRQPTQQLLARFCQIVFNSGIQVLETSIAAIRQRGSVVEAILRRSVVTVLLTPMVHGLCFCVSQLHLVREVLPLVVKLLQGLSQVTQTCRRCELSSRVVAGNIKRIVHKPGTVSTHKGWRPVKAEFEDSDPSFSVTDNGSLYTAVHSSNTCATVSVCFSSPTKAAWEFCLEADTVSDECSVFGAAQMPLSSRCYSSSPDLWMRRAYNGYMYARGRTTGNTMEKIHPGDVVRVVFDGRAGTLAYGVNGSEPEVAFTDITGEIFPACGSYRSGVQIRLVKVEVFGGSTTDGGEDKSCVEAHWVVPEDMTDSRDSAVLTPAKSIDKGQQEVEKDLEKRRTWVTARADSGATEGIHDWSFELMERSKVPLAFGVVCGGDPYVRDRLAGPCLVEVKAPMPEEASTAVLSTPASPRPTSLPTIETFIGENPARARSEPDRILILDDDEGRPPEPERPRLIFGEHSRAPESERYRLRETIYGGRLRSPRPPLRQSPLIIGLEAPSPPTTTPRPDPLSVPASAPRPEPVAVSAECKGGVVSKLTGQRQDPPRKAMFSYDQKGVLAMAWCTDSSLWVNGEKRADGFGKHVFPLDRHSCVTVRIDRVERTVSYYVNGAFVGVAFGPEESGAAVISPLPLALEGESVLLKNAVYPAASVSSPAQSLRIKPTGFFGSVVIPTSLLLQKSAASVVGRLLSVLMTGPEVDRKEQALAHWLQSPLLIGGISPEHADTDHSTGGTTNEIVSPIRSWAESWEGLTSSFGTARDASVPSWGCGSSGTAAAESSVGLSGEVVITAFRAEALRTISSAAHGKEAESHPTLRLRITHEGSELDTQSRKANFGDAVFPVWDSSLPITLKYDIGDSKSGAISRMAGTAVRLLVEIILADDTSPVGQAVIDLQDLAVTESKNGPTCRLIPLTPQGVILLHIESTSNVDAKNTENGDVLEADNDSNAAERTGKSLLDTDTPNCQSDARLLDTFLEDVVASEFASGSQAAGRVLMGWLESINEDPAYLRKALEKAGNFSFPKCEYPFVACLLKHGGLVGEAFAAVGDINCGQPVPKPSNDMISLWVKVKQLRMYLRSQKQKFKAEGIVEKGAASIEEEVSSLASKIAMIRVVDSAADDEVLFQSTSGSAVDLVNVGTVASAGQDSPPGTPGAEVTMESVAGEVPIEAMATPRTAPVDEHENAVAAGAEHEHAVAESIGGIFVSPRIAWREQPAGTQSRYNAAYVCDVTALGIDFANNLVYVRFNVRGDNSLGPLQAPTSSRLFVDETEVRVAAHTYDAESETSYSGCLRFDLPVIQDVDALTVTEIEFMFGQSGYSMMLLALPLASETADAAGISEEKIEEPESFDALCDALYCRAKFLLTLMPARIELDVPSDSARSKEMLLQLTDKVTAAPKLSRFRSDDGEDRWRRVTDFLKVHSRIRRNISASSGGRASNAVGYTGDVAGESLFIDKNNLNNVSVLTVSEEEISDEKNVSAAQAAMQACSVFVTSEGGQVAPDRLCEVMHRRSRRAELRTFALQALRTLLSLTDVCQDPFATEEILLFVRSSFVSGTVSQSTSKKKAATIPPTGSSRSQVHYLSNLESCPAAKLGEVQHAFLEVYSSLAFLTMRYIATWEAASSPPAGGSTVLSWPLKDSSHTLLGPLRLMLSLWSLHFSSRDYRFLLECGILSTLHKLLSVESYERAVISWMDRATELLRFKTTYASLLLEMDSNSNSKWQPWSSAYVQDGLRSGAVSARSVLLHLSLMPDTAVPHEERKALGLGDDFEELCRSPVAKVSLLYEQVLCLIRRKEELAQKVLDKKKAEELLLKAQLEEEKRLKLVAAGVPLFGSSKDFKSDDVLLEDACQVAYLRSPRSPEFKVACVFCTVCYDVNEGSDVTGNYFEVEVLEAIEKDIGVGLAVQASFPVDGGMPGWDTNTSLGYHGDDGKKFGDGATEGTWPTWNVGDVIGCGLDMSRRAVFYTRNGVLLGDGFTNVRFETLTPTIGFHASRCPQKVKVNFGVTPMRYTGPEVIIHPKALAEQAKVLRERQHVAERVEASERSAIEEEKAEGGELVEEKIEDEVELDSSTLQAKLSTLESNLESATAYLVERNSLRNYASGLMRFLFAVTCNGDTVSRPHAEVGMALPEGLAMPILPDRSLSTFGTKLRYTEKDGAALESWIVSTIMSEVLTGARLLSRRSDSSSVFQSVLSNSSCDLATDTQSSKVAEEADAASVESFGQRRRQVLELAEIDTKLFEYLVSLQALVTADSWLREMLASTKALEALLLLLVSASPRVQRVTVNLLCVCLPAVSPEAVEEAVPEQWKAAMLPLSEKASRRKSRRRSDSLIRALLSCIRAVVSVPPAPRPGSSLSSVRFSPHVDYGLGNVTLANIDRYTVMIRTLFESPMWRELIASIITDSIRNAGQVLGAWEQRADDAPQEMSVDEEEDLLSACAACTVIGSAGLLRPGAKAQIDEGTSCIVVQMGAVVDKANVIFSDYCLGQKGLQHIETVDLSSLTPVCDVVKVDLQSLSQPLLPQLITLVKRVLSWFSRESIKSAAESKSRSGLHSLLTRLSSLLTTCLSLLLDQQADAVVESISDSDIIRNIIQVALIPTGLSYFPSLQATASMWSACQARILEFQSAAVVNGSRPDVSKLLDPGNKSDKSRPGVDPPTLSVLEEDDSILFSEPEPVVTVTKTRAATMSDILPNSYPRISREEGDTTAGSQGGPATLLTFDDADRARRGAIATVLAAELSLDVTMCSCVLDYFMMDVSAARACLLANTGVIDKEGFSDTSFTMMFANKVDFSDENPLRNIDHQIVDLTPSIEATVASTVPYDRTLEKIICVAEDESATRRAHQLQNGQLLCVSDDEGPISSSGSPIGMCMSPGPASADMIVSFCNEDLGACFSSCLSSESMRLVTAFFDCPVQQLPTLIHSLDSATTILRMRQIAAKFLVDGGVLNPDRGKSVQEWLQLIKLTSTTHHIGSSISNASLAMPNPPTRPSVAGSGESLFSLCNSLLSRAATSQQVSADQSSASTSVSLEDQVMEVLVKDVSDGFTVLTDTSVTAKPGGKAISRGESAVALDKKDESKGKEAVMFSSPHPFTAPHINAGAINIPTTWKGLLVSFHPKCSTPSNLATLSFYRNESDLKDDRPCNILWGDAPSSSQLMWGSDEISHSFHSLILTGVSTLYYRFKASAGSDKPPLGVISIEGNLRINTDGTVEKSIDADAVGLGEEDTLFNLFATSSADRGISGSSEAALAAVDCPWLLSGVWFFETQILDVGGGDSPESKCGLRLLVKKNRGDEGQSNLVSETVVALVSNGSIYVVRDKAWTSQLSPSWGDWSAEDVLGCLFSIDTTTTKVWFAKNGMWSAPIEIETALSGVRPAFALSKGSKMKPNFGESAFKFSPNDLHIFALIGQTWKPMICRPVDTPVTNNWGYQFKVQPLTELSLKVAREFDLIWKVNLSEVDSKCDKLDQVCVWRPKATSEFVGTGDIICAGAPRGAVVVDRQQCTHPTSFKKVFSSAKLAVTVWRPVPALGYVSMGDVVVPSHNGSAPALSICACVPQWAVKKCEIGARIMLRKGDGKSSPVSLWSVQNSLGTFFGSHSDHRSADSKSSSTESSTGVGRGFCLRGYKVRSMLSGEWADEQDVLHMPSLSWVCCLQTFLLENPKTRRLALTKQMFLTIMKYMRSDAAPAPLKVIPLVIRMVRLAAAEGVSLGLDQVEGLCKTILAAAVGRIQADKTGTLPDALLGLVDVVVEVQSANILDATRSNACEGKGTGVSFPHIEESKDEVELAESKEEEAPLLLTKDNLQLDAQRVVSRAWWDRTAVSRSAKDESALVALTTVGSLFVNKEPLLQRLRTVLEFLASIGGRSKGSETSGSSSSAASTLPVSMIAKTWFEHCSLCALQESAHPYSGDSVAKKVTFPGADKLHITFDRRSSLGPGASLVISGGGQRWERKGDQEDRWSRTITVVADSVDISFDVTVDKESGTDPNPKQDWGWALVIGAVGPVYEKATVDILLPDKSLPVIIPVAAAADSNTETGPATSVDNAAEDQSMSETPMFSSPGICFSSAGIPESNIATSSLFTTPPLPSASSTPSVVLTPVDGKPEPIYTPAKKYRPSTTTSPLATMSQDLMTMAKVVSDGSLVSSGSMKVPHATQLEVLIDRPQPRVEKDDPSAQLLHVLVLTFLEPGVTSTETAKERTHTLSLPGSSLGARVNKVQIKAVDGAVKYDLYAMSEAELQALQEAEMKTIPEEISAEGEPSEFFSEAKEGSAEVADSAKEAEVKSEETPAPLAPEFPSEVEWSCPRCTLINPMEEPRCSVCDLPNPLPPTTASPATLRERDDGPTTEELVIRGAGWWCPQCTFINQLTRETCVMCDFANESLSGATDASPPPPPDHMDVAEDAFAAAMQSVSVRRLRRATGGIENSTTVSRSVDGRAGAVASGGTVRDPEPIEEAEPVASLSALKTSSIWKADADVVRITIVGVGLTDSKRFESRIEAALMDKRTTPLGMQKQMLEWDRAADTVLLEYINSVTLDQTTSTRSLLQNPINFAVSRKYLSYRFSGLAHATVLDVQSRAMLFEAFNKGLEEILPVVNLQNTDPCSLGAMIRRCNSYVFMHLKQPMLEKAIAATTVSTGSPATLMLDNFKALVSRDRNDRDPSKSQSCFVQAFKQLNSKDPVVFKHIFNGDRVFQINFEGESGIDAGGVFREGVTRIIEDLFSEHLNLLLLCPNGQHEVHTNMDKYLPNPAHTGPLTISMFEFVGKLMGMSLRAKLSLPFEFPSMVWKQLVGEEAAFEDLMAIDVITCKLLDAVRHCEKDEILDQEAFAAKYENKLRFVCTGSDGVERCLCAGGKDKVVTFDNREEFCDQVLAVRLTEFNKQIAAISRGMATVVPMRILQLFSWQQLEVLVSGNPKIDIDLWKSKTEASSVPPKTLSLFWKVMESLTPREQMGFVRFAWGRSRLPALKDFTVKMKLSSAGRAKLPVAHTCFFSVELPDYSTEEEMRHGLLTAIHYGSSGVLLG